MIPGLDSFIASLADLGRSMDRLSRALAREVDPSLRPRRWSKKEIREFRARFPNEPTAALAKQLGRSPSSCIGMAAHLGLHKSAKYMASGKPYEGFGRHPKFVANRIQKGNVPWNKGMKGLQTPGSEKGWFKKGVKPLNTWKPVGTERVSKDGYLERKVTDVGGYNNEDWKPVAHLVWEKRRGPVPKGHIVGFKNGNKRDFRLSNLVLRTFAENMRLNTIHRYPKEIVRLAMTLGALNRKINAKIRNSDAKEQN